MKPTAELKVLPVSVLKPAAYNPRKKLKPGDKEYEKIKNSIEEFGFADPLVVNADMTIIGGHQRLTVAMQLGYTEVPCAVVDVDKTREKALNIALNKITGAWDEQLLAEVMKDIQEADFDLGFTGFDAPDIESLFNKAFDKDIKEDDFDVEAELKKPAFSKPDDIWFLGRHKVICGDSTLPETFEKLLGSKKVNLVCTDAPYFVNLENKSGKIANDDLDDKEAYAFLMKVFTNFKNSMAKDASIYEFYATMKTRIFYDAFEDAGFRVGAGLIWKKPRAPFMRTDWKFNMEPIIWGWRKDGKHIWYGDQKQTAVFEFDGIKDSEKEGCGHPSSKPVQLIAYLIKQCTMTNGLVLDGFLGSASTLIACEQLERVCYGVELEVKFVDVAVSRYVAFHDGRSSDVYVIEKKRGRQVPVLVWQISESDEASLDMYEGFPRFYYKSMMPVEVHSLLDGRTLGVVDALIYIMHEERLKGCPTSRYFDVCLGGYTRFGFPVEKLFKAVTDSIGKRAADRFLAGYRETMPEQQMA